MTTRRPLTVTIAIVLLLLLSAFGLLMLVNKPPLIIFNYVFIAMVGGGLIAAFGLWKLKRWGLLLTSVIAAPSIVVAGTDLWLDLSTGGKVILGLTLCYVLVLVLLAFPATRKAIAAARAPVTA